MTHTSGDGGAEQPQVPAEMLEYLQTFLDETEEQLEDLVESLLALETETNNVEELNEAFRLIHSIKGSAGMMGLDSITVLTHHLETRFERFRSGAEQLDQQTMNVVLRSIDFLKQCSQRLRSNQQLGSPAQLLDELKSLSEAAEEKAAVSADGDPADSLPSQSTEAATLKPDSPGNVALPESDDELLPDDQQQQAVLLALSIHFQPELPLVDLKARLILNRLSALGTVQHFTPDIDKLADPGKATEFLIHFATQADENQIRELAEVDGVDTIEFNQHFATTAEPQHDQELIDSDSTQGLPNKASEVLDAAAELESGELVASETADEDVAEAEISSGAGRLVDATLPIEQSDFKEKQPEVGTEARDDDSSAESQPNQHEIETAVVKAANGPHSNVGMSEDVKCKAEGSPVAPTEPMSSLSGQTRHAPSTTATKLSETMRVDIERLDKLMNLAGELVVNRARFQQVLNAMDPAWRKTGMLNRMRDFTDRLRETLASLENAGPAHDKQSAEIQGLAEGIGLLQEQCEILENGRRSFESLAEAMDQLSLVSHSLQRGVLDTRMIPVAPLFNRFKRIVRDLSRERGKSVRLEIRGEKTELDKRMIDELGDPLVHLIRNSIDHGMESPEQRERSGKPATGTIVLEASHSGNNVFVYVRDDGDGIDIEKVRGKIVANGLRSLAAASDLNDEQILEFIWHPGFSTADRVSDVSGRGVGMDVVRNRITSLNGTVDVDSLAGQGTTFAIRLPLTLAIMECLLVRLRSTVFSIPIDDVREIVSFHRHEVISVNAQRSFELREEYIPLVKIEDVFDWNGTAAIRTKTKATTQDEPAENRLRVVVLQVSGKTLGLQVDELMGSQDIVVKSLSENFTDIGGLSGASILGDGRVCLMLDVDKLMGIALRFDTHTAMEVQSQ